MEWISVKDKEPMPDYFYDVWVRSTDNPEYGRRATNISYSTKHGWGFSDDFQSMEYVSHYMKAPAPPTTKGEK